MMMEHEMREIALMQSRGEIDESEVHFRLENLAHECAQSGFDESEIASLLQDSLMDEVERTKDVNASVSDGEHKSIHDVYGPPVPGRLLNCGDIVQRSSSWGRGSEDGGLGMRGMVWKIDEDSA